MLWFQQRSRVMLVNAPAIDVVPVVNCVGKVRAGYEELLAKLLDRPEGETLEEAVEINYDQIDIQFLTLLNQKVRCLLSH